MSIYASAHAWISGADDARVFEAPRHESHMIIIVGSHPRTRGVVKQTVAQTSGYVENLTFHMPDSSMSMA